MLSILFPFNSYFLVNDLLWGLNFVSDNRIVLQGQSSEFKNVKLEFKDNTLKIWNSPRKSLQLLKFLSESKVDLTLIMD